MWKKKRGWNFNFFVKKEETKGLGSPRSSSVICFRPQKEKKFRSFPEKLKRSRD